ncbi:MAG: hypothetical protein HPY76_09390 [Anaerolineae bacterium]|nr:hypothetical protein [Anaerolineae bacterium]
MSTFFTRSLVIILSIFILTACAAPAATPEAAQVISENARALPAQRGDHFATAGTCTACHTSLKDAAGNDLSYDTLWRSSMMANALRDPYYRATVRQEIEAKPEHRAVIEEKCAVCHVPMSFTTQTFAGETVTLLDDGAANPDHPLHTLADDGISCTVCHQIQAENFGLPESFTGGYLIDSETPTGERMVYGPYPTADTTINLMKAATGFVPQQSDHLASSDTCAVCHVLYTPIIDAEGNFSDQMFPEQMPYMEWRHSGFAETRSCQDCHMPEVDGTVMIATTGGEARTGVNRHTFAGGNAYMVDLLRTFGNDLAVHAKEEHFQQTIDLTHKLLQESTATLEIDTAREGETLAVTVTVNNLAGHKLPSAFPSRRAWLHVLVQDAAGVTAFESGGWAPESGAIFGNDHDVEEALYEPHYETITDDEQVQIYEAIMGDLNGAVTTTLLDAAAYVKDNRLLPLGFDKATAETDIAVVGAALDDANFGSGGDTVRYEIATSAEGALTVTVELLYQSIGFQWGEKFAGQETAEAMAFNGYRAELPSAPVILYQDTVTLE